MIPLPGRGTTWVVADVAAKLAARARLPGAFTFDRTIHTLRLAREAGVAPRELVAPALSASWLVNSATPSPVFRAWLSPPLLDVWDELASALAREGAWSSFTEDDRATITSALGALCVEGQGVGAVSKVLAALAPESVPLMPDAALAFALGRPERSAALDAQTARADAFAPMMTWFTDAVARAAPALARDMFPDVPLTAAEVLDRVLWFDSAGVRHFLPRGSTGGFVPVRDGDRVAVVAVEAALDDELLRGVREDAPLDLAKPSLPPALREAAARTFGDAT